MKKFLAIYMGTTSSEKMQNWNAMNEADQKTKLGEGMNAWTKWAEKHAEAILDHGGPLGKTKLTDQTGVSDMKNLMTGYTIVEAPSHQAAAEMFQSHPHFSIFPGESVEIMEILPLPS